MSLVILGIWGGVASYSRLLKIIGLFCKRDLEKRRYSAKETRHFKEPANRSHPMPGLLRVVSMRQVAYVNESCRTCK